MGGIFSSPKPAPAPIPAPPPPVKSDAEVNAAARDERLRRAKASGRASTILTSGQGTTDTNPTTKTLLGQ